MLIDDSVAMLADVGAIAVGLSGLRLALRLDAARLGLAEPVDAAPEPRVAPPEPEPDAYIWRGRCPQCLTDTLYERRIGARRHGPAMRCKSCGWEQSDGAAGYDAGRATVADRLPALTPDWLRLAA